MSNTVTGGGGILGRRRAIRRTLLATALALASTLSIIVAISPQAHASLPPPSPCSDPHTICLFEHNAFEWLNGGRWVVYKEGSRDMSRFGPFFNDMTSSIWNSSTDYWCVYEHANYRGAHERVSPNTFYRSLGLFNDVISSVKKATGFSPLPPFHTCDRP